MRRDIVTSVIGIIVLTVLLGLVYPLVITGVSQVAFPGNANGQKVFVNGKLVGSKIIGQSFGGDPRYFQSRPSATEGGAYNAAASTFSNRGPNDKATEQADAENIKAYLELVDAHHADGHLKPEDVQSLLLPEKKEERLGPLCSPEEPIPPSSRARGQFPQANEPS